MIATDYLHHAWRRQRDLMRQSMRAAAERSEQIAQIQVDTLQTLMDRGNRCLRDSLSTITPESASWTRLLEKQTKLLVENMRTCVESAARMQGLMAEAIQTQLPAIRTALVDAVAQWNLAAPQPPADQGATAKKESWKSPIRAAKAASRWQGRA